MSEGLPRQNQSPAGCAVEVLVHEGSCRAVTGHTQVQPDDGANSSPYASSPTDAACR
jgi:hypothetical protein